jgi:hypothetical protein
MALTLKRSTTFTIGVLLHSVLLAGCSEESNRLIAERGASELRSRLDAEDYSRIYSDADPSLRKRTTEADFIGLFQTVQLRLGKRTRSTLRSLHEDWSFERGTVITASYETVFEKGTADERISWVVTKDTPALLEYLVSSDAISSP